MANPLFVCSCDNFFLSPLFWRSLGEVFLISAISLTTLEGSGGMAILFDCLKNYTWQIKTNVLPYHQPTQLVAKKQKRRATMSIDRKQKNMCMCGGMRRLFFVRFSMRFPTRVGWAVIFLFPHSLAFTGEPFVVPRYLYFWRSWCKTILKHCSGRISATDECDDRDGVPKNINSRQPPCFLLDIATKSKVDNHHPQQLKER